MTENQSNLTPKELYEHRRAARRRDGAGGAAPAAASGRGRKLGLWLIVIVILGGAIFGLYKLATTTPPGAIANGVLTDVIGDGDWTLGDKKAAVQLVEYADFQCPACAFYAPWIRRLAGELKDKVGITYRFFPLSQIHQNAELSARLAQAAGLQGRFWEMAELLFSNQSLWEGRLDARDFIISLAKADPILGQLNFNKLLTDADSATVKNVVAQNYQSGIRAGVQGTPTFFLNGKQIENPKTYEAFRALLSQ